VFRNFASRTERITNGLRAFDTTATAGWKTIAAALRQYYILPTDFFVDSQRHFDNLRAAAAGAVA